MESKKRIRILNSNRYLSSFLQENEEFHIGLLYEEFEEFLKSGLFRKYGFPDEFSDGLSILPKAIGPATKVNVNGKYVRKQPEEKETKTVLIDYERKGGTRVRYERDYYVYVKELLHKFNISLEYHKNKHGQEVLVSNRLIYKDDIKTNQKNTQVINIFCEIFRSFEVFTTEFEPAINFNKRFEMELLPKGQFTDKAYEEVIEISKHYVKNDSDHKAFQKRLHILQKYNPDIRGKGPTDFYGYIVFGFTEMNIVVLEAMYSDNATYVFSLDDYENKVIMDKQQALHSKYLIKRFYHYDDWESRIKRFFESIDNKPIAVIAESLNF